MKRDRFITYQGVTLTQLQWARRLGVKPSTLYSRIHRWGAEYALSMGPALLRNDPRWRAGPPPMPLETVNTEPGCPVCHLRGDHECLRGDATAGLGQWKGSEWSLL